jgi:predicted Zn-dependent peptidase
MMAVLAPVPNPGRTPDAEVAVQQQVFTHTFPNGLTLLAERMEHVRSASLLINVPAGCVYDPPEQLGLSGVLAELITRGAGERDSVELTMALDNLGVDHGEGVDTYHTRFRAATIAKNLAPALDIYADILRRPHFPDDELDPVKALALQNLSGLEDDPDARVLIELHKHIYPTPLCNDQLGTVAGVEAITSDTVRAQFKHMFRPRGTIISVAGYIEWEPLKEQVGQLLGDWPNTPDVDLTIGPPPAKRAHLTKDLEQTQISLAYPSVPVTDPDFYNAMGAVNVLSGGMSARLFTEIREKEGLVYGVRASYQPLRDRASVVCYASSKNAQAQRALDVLLRELNRLTEGVTEEEVERVRAGLKTSLIMQQESTRARAGALASNWFNLGRIRSMDEIQSAIDGLSVQSITEHVRRYPPRDFSVVTMGPEPLELK